MKIGLAATAAFLLLAVSGATSADTFAVRLVSETSSTITLGWAPQPGYGYLFSANGTLVSRTNDPSRSTVKFAKADSYDIDVIVKGVNGHYPEVTPPPPATAKITQTIADNSTITSLVNWRAVYDADNDGIEDDPGTIRFLIDGTMVLTESLIPFGDTFADGSLPTSNGQHTFEVQAYDDNGELLVTNTVTATVNNETPTPPPPGAYPDATNTGVPSGTVLATYSGPLNITVGNTVIDSKRLPCLTINAPGVVIKNSLISENCFFDIEINSGSLTIQDSEINCQGPNSKGILGGDFTALRVNIHNCEDGMYVSSNWTLQDSFIHNLAVSSTAHNDGIQSTNGSNSTIRHNRIYGVDTSAVNINNVSGGPNTQNMLIENNLLAGGGWTLYCPRESTTNFRIINNAFSTIFYPNVGSAGPHTDCEGESASGNYVYETGVSIPIP